ncbi:ureidoglycolate lyase [Paraglaciecola aestuariivivens]
MKTLTLKAQPLTKEAFAAYGDVIETSGAEHFGINQNTVERYHNLAVADADYVDGGRTIISLASVKQPCTLPHLFNLIERHPKGSQAFIPMFNTPVYTVVAAKGDSVKAEDLQAFVTNGKQGFSYHRGVWHMPIMADEKGKMFVMIDRAGPGNNCDEYSFEDYQFKLID